MYSAAPDCAVPEVRAAIRLLVSPPNWLMAWAIAHNSVPSRASFRPSSSCALSWMALTIASLASRSQLASRLARNERPSSPVISAGVLRRNSRYFASSPPSSLSQVVAGLAEEHDRRAAVLLEGLFQELVVAVGDRLDRPDRLVPIAGPVLDPQDLRQAIGPGDLQVVDRLLDRIQVPLLRVEQRGEILEPDLVDRPLDHQGAADDQAMGRDVVLGPLHEPIRVGVGDVERAPPLLEDQQADLAW